VIERWIDDPPVPGELGPVIEGRIVGVIDRSDPPDPPPQPEVGPIERRIGELVAERLPDGATVQWGPGAVPAAVLAALDRPVRVDSGLVTDELVDLDGRGMLAAPAEAAYLWGGRELRAMIAEGRLTLREVEHTHDPTRISAIDRFVAINTALEVGLDGAANVEMIRTRAGGTRVVSGPGGHPDFCVGASRSVGGLSIVALRATAGGRSSIVPRPLVVTSPHTDVDLVVTEYGVADLRDLDAEERATRLIAVAAPEHREELARAASMPGGEGVVG
jgi:acyl-CoA hydrolase